MKSALKKKRLPYINFLPMRKKQLIGFLARQQKNRFFFYKMCVTYYAQTILVQSLQLTTA